MTDGFGKITFWGFSPAIDLLERHHEVQSKLKKKGLKTDETDENLRILLVGGGDLRHVLKTVAQSWRHRKRKLHFFIVENSLELYVRDMLLMSLVLEPQSRMGIREKMELYLELYGNLLVRQQTVDYIRYMANEMIKMITDSDYLEEKLPCVDLSKLKYKEIDMMEGVAKFWRRAERPVFDAHNHWDQRLRQNLGLRYDAIPNIFDWDYNMKLCDRGAEIINGKVYNIWRKTGVAFEIRDGTYNQPNYTLASGVVIKKGGERIPCRGYWGDILVSPYISHGIESEDQSLFQKKNNVLANTSIDVAVYNMTALFHELAHQAEYKPELETAATGGSTQQPAATLTEITEEDEEPEENTSKDEEETGAKEEEPTQPQDPLTIPYTSMPLEDVKITFLPLNSAEYMKDKECYQKLFNVVYFSNSMVHLLKPELNATFADNAHIILESAKFMLELKPEETTEFGKKIVTLGGAAGCKTLGEFDGATDAVIDMVYQPS